LRTIERHFRDPKTKEPLCNSMNEPTTMGKVGMTNTYRVNFPANADTDARTNLFGATLLMISTSFEGELKA